MKGQEYRDAIERLGLTQVGAARFLGVSDSTSRRWIADQSPIPNPVAMLLYTMISYNLSPNSIASLVKNQRSKKRDTEG